MSLNSIMQRILKSKISHDEIIITFSKKKHKAYFELKLYDNATEHFQLINNLTKLLKYKDIKWVEIELLFNPVIPINAITYINKKTNNFVCHIEDFEKLYLINLAQIIQIKHIYYCNSQKSVDGWIKVSDYKKDKYNKYIEIIEELKILVCDWNNL